MPLPFNFDFKNPEYRPIFEWRIERLKRIRQTPEILPQLKQFYKNNPAQFIIDWGVTIDPRNIEIGQPALVPFILFPKQEDYINWFMALWRSRKPGAVAKSREVGMSWLTMALDCTLCLFNYGLIVGVGSRKEEYVDLSGSPKSLFHKARLFMHNLPKEFRGDWDPKKHAPHMRLMFPEMASIIEGEAGNNLGRGSRYSFYNFDEAAFHQHPALVESALSMTTNCRIDISTPNGMNNPFAQKVQNKKISIFYVRWQDDPRKDLEWYKRKCDEIDDPVIIAQELDLNFSASVKGVVIPAEWVNAAIDAHLKLGIEPTGQRRIGQDIADEGRDINSAIGMHGIVALHCKGWSGIGSDITETVKETFLYADENDYAEVIYDADGLGVGARGDARVENEKRKDQGIHEIDWIPFRGSGPVANPEQEVYPRKPGTPRERRSGRLNQDFFANAKAQGWWELRRRFRLTYRAIVLHEAYDPDELISISSKIDNFEKLILELSQPTYQQNTIGKIIIDKKPDNARSPNYADSLMICCAPLQRERRGLGSVN